jgi:hypothetical protein
MLRGTKTGRNERTEKQKQVLWNSFEQQALLVNENSSYWKERKIFRITLLFSLSSTSTLSVFQPGHGFPG